VLDAVDLLLQRRRDGRCDDFGAGARILTGTLTTGGAISGYCAMGRRLTETTPMITNTIDMTAAKIGLSMKKCEIRICRSVN